MEKELLLFQSTNIVLNEVSPVRYKVVGFFKFSPLLNPHEMFHRVQTPAARGRHQELFDGHRLPQSDVSNLVMKTELEMTK